MAGFASLRERSLVRVVVARGASVELQSEIVEVLGIPADRRVALLAIQSNVRTGKWVLGLGVIELLR